MLPGKRGLKEIGLMSKEGETYYVKQQEKMQGVRKMKKHKTGHKEMQEEEGVATF